ncbi:MAG: hypothetical protein MUP49_04990, partial [Dehalococcoidia bacterium]|nr:hypothetical protein [Dehalococcoidia bacterium]
TVTGSAKIKCQGAFEVVYELAVPREEQRLIKTVFFTDFPDCFGCGVFTGDFDGYIAADKGK